MKIAHIADTHLRQRQYGVPGRGDDFVTGLSNAIKKACKSGASAIVAAGDILDSSNPGSPVCITQLDKIQGLLVSLNIPMFVISGNHDKTSPSWCSRFDTVYDNTKIGIKCIDDMAIEFNGLKIVGVPYLSGSEMRERLENNSIPKGDILVWHGDIAEMSGFPPEGAITMAELAKAKRWRVVAMGHIHIHDMRKKDGVIVAYPGSTELCESSEEFNKKFYMYDIGDKNTEIKVESIPFTTRAKQKFTINSEEELEEAISKFKKDSIIFVEYDESIQNCKNRLELAVTPKNILRAVTKTCASLTSKIIRAGDVGSPVAFLKENICSLTDSPERAKRIEGICTAVLSQNVDYTAAIEQFCDDRLKSITL